MLTTINTVFSLGLNIAAVLLQVWIDQKEPLHVYVVFIRHLCASVVVDAPGRGVFLPTVDLADLGRGGVIIVGRLNGEAM